MILLIGPPTEPPLALALAALRALQAPVLLLEPRTEKTCQMEMELDADGPRGSLTIEGKNYPLGEITAIYARPAEPARSANTALRRVARLHDLLFRWMEFAPGVVVNRPAAMGSNVSKPYQSQLIRRAGFDVPATLLTSDPEAALAFRHEHGRVIYKSISGARSIVTELREDALDRLHLIRHCPVQFQALVEGIEVRVHTIGHEVFASRATSGAIDYRYAIRKGEKLELESFDLPAELADRCRQLACDLGLDFTGIDLKLTPEGRAVCFEVNPCPAYSFFEEHTGQPIAAALARHLATGEKAAAPRVHAKSLAPACQLCARAS